MNLLLALLLLATLRWVFPERPLDATGLGALWDLSFAVGLSALVMLVAWSLGIKLLQWISLGDRNRIESAIFAIPLGLGVLAYGVFIIGLFGQLTDWTILLWLFLVAWWTRNQSVGIFRALGSELPKIKNKVRHQSRARQAYLVLMMLILILAFFGSLAPPTGYDGLMYHLYGPQQYLNTGRYQILEGPVQTNYPFTVQMLFTIGLSFESDTFAQLIHLSFSVCLAVATFAFARRYASEGTAWLAVIILVSIPIFPIWSQISNVDSAWALYEFVGIYALVFWLQNRSRSYLILAAVMIGFSIGVKYQALIGGLLYGIWVIWKSRSNGTRQIINNAIIFGGISLLIASPWFLKNLVWTGNPIFPYIFGGPGWSDEQLFYLNQVLSNFGTGKRVTDYLLLPWNIYFQNEKFSSLAGLEIPSILFPLAMLYPLSRKEPAITALAWLTLLRFLSWAITPHTRYLMPVFAGLSIVSAFVFINLTFRTAFRRLLQKSLLFTLLGIAIIFQTVFLSAFSPLKVVLGLESKADYLYRTVNDFAGIRYVMQFLSPEDRVIMLWDARAYYCDNRCVPDRAHQFWPLLYLKHRDNRRILDELLELGATHIFYAEPDSNFLIDHDPTGLHLESRNFLLDVFVPNCTIELYSDRSVHVFELAPCR